MSESLEERYATLALALHILRHDVRSIRTHLDSGNIGRVREYVQQLQRNIDSFCEQHPDVEIPKEKVNQ